MKSQIDFIYFLCNNDQEKQPAEIQGTSMLYWIEGWTRIWVGLGTDPHSALALGDLGPVPLSPPNLHDRMVVEDKMEGGRMILQVARGPH